MLCTPAFSTCDLCDDHKSDCSGAFRVLPSVFRNFGARQRVAGPIATVQCLDHNSLGKAAVQSPGEGRDLVVRVQGVAVRPGEWLYADEDGALIADRVLHPVCWR